MTMWPQLALLVLISMRFVGAVHADRDKGKLTTGQAFFVNILYFGVLIALLYFGNFWAPLGYPAY